MEEGLLRLRAPAKINLSLEVLGKRADGYHELRMLMAPVSLFDEVVLERLPEPGRVEVRSNWAQVGEGEQNLCHRAARYYLERAGVGAGVRVRLTKRIPAGAGLGGGSSDAAATILGLEELFGRSLSPECLTDAAFRVGADVPFFFARAPAWVEGIGERVQPLPEFPRLWLVIVHPGAFLSTAAVFSRYRAPGNMELTRSQPPPTMPAFDFRCFVGGLRNDLQPVALGLEPAVGEALDALARVGAAGALMSGSGCATFGLFEDEARAREAQSALSRQPRVRDWFVEVVHTLAPGSFPFLPSSALPREDSSRAGA
jgi:4-diphosphocytidyl-2-C-methyl-D-erythritol kinase